MSWISAAPSRDSRARAPASLLREQPGHCVPPWRLSIAKLGLLRGAAVAPLAVERLAQRVDLRPQVDHDVLYPVITAQPQGSELRCRFGVGCSRRKR